MYTKFNFRKHAIESAFFVLILLCLILGIYIGVFGGDTFYQIIMAKLVLRFDRVIVFVQILYAVFEFLGGIAFFMILYRKLFSNSWLFPVTIKQLKEQQNTREMHAYYLPGAFSLGVFVALAFHPLFILWLELAW